MSEKIKTETIDSVYRATWQAISKMYNEQANKYGTSMSVGFALLIIDPVNGTPSTSIAPKMGMEATSLSRTLKSMEVKGFVEKCANPDDGRGVIVKLTKLGKQKRMIAKSLVLSFNDCLKKHFSQLELDSFISMSNKIIDIINTENIYQSNQAWFD